MKTTERAVQNQTAIWSATLSTDAENSERVRMFFFLWLTCPYSFTILVFTGKKKSVGEEVLE